eukprot:937159-Pelagomonas_calceolata.AAC.7
MPPNACTSQQNVGQQYAMHCAQIVSNMGVPGSGGGLRIQHQAVVATRPDGGRQPQRWEA